MTPTFEHLSTTENFRVLLAPDHYKWLSTTGRGQAVIQQDLNRVALVGGGYVYDAYVDDQYLYFSCRHEYASNVEAFVLDWIQWSYNEMISSKGATPA